VSLRATGLSTHAWNTALRSILLLAGFPFLLTMLCFGLALVLADTGNGLGSAVRDALDILPAAIAFGLVASGIWFAIAWAFHQRILDAVTGAHPVERAAEPRLWQLAETLCISRGIAVPRLAVMESPSRNAFASGLSRETGAVTVTRGLMEALDDRELSAVLAHELSHIRNGDARLGVIAAVFAGVLSLAADLFGRVRISSSSDSRRGGSAAGIVGVVLILLAGALAVALRFALSRQREFLADAGSVQMTRDPDAMISALRKVAGHAEMPAVPGQVQALMLDWPAGESRSAAYATHPPLEERIAALVRYAGGHDPGPLQLETDTAVAEVRLGPWGRQLGPPDAGAE
jgi:heat shock protein HtpX